MCEDGSICSSSRVVGIMESRGGSGNGQRAHGNTEMFGIEQTIDVLVSVVPLWHGRLDTRWGQTSRMPVGDRIPGMYQQHHDEEKRTK